MKNYKVAIIGRPNVGKSSIFNRLVGRRQAIVHGIAGTTRDAVCETVYDSGKCFELSDTAGYLKEKGNVLNEEALKRVNDEVNAADLLVLIVDGNISPTNEDQKIIDTARKTGKTVFLVVNKVDNKKVLEGIKEYERFGFKNFFATSAIHNIGITELKNAIIDLAPNQKKKVEVDKTIKVAIVGRPNVGKSSMLNSLIRKDAAIVTDIPGTTRDVVTGEIIKDKVSFRLSDTAGARKPGKIGKAYKKGEPVEKFSFLRTQAEIEKADIVLVVLDASEKIAAQDLHIAGKAKELGKGIVLVINKWDLVSDVTQEKFLSRLRYRFNFMIWVPSIFVSAKTGKNIEEIPKIITGVYANQTRQIPTAKLNRIIEDYNIDNPPAGMKGLRPKTFFAVQTGVLPPTIKITAKHHEFVHFSYKRALENELRRHFDFTGTPIRIEFSKKG